LNDEDIEQMVKDAEKPECGQLDKTKTARSVDAAVTVRKAIHLKHAK
jgi:hypothetical protein